MRITRENYESWFLDYLEGNLDEKGMEMVRHFLSQYPDLNNELEAFSHSLIADNRIQFPAKELLKKKKFDDSELFKNSAVAYVEGDLEPGEVVQFERWLENKEEPQLYLQTMKSCRLQPNLAISFPERGKLKKNGSVINFSRVAAAVAAILLLALFVLHPAKKEDERHSDQQIATISSPKEVSTRRESTILSNLSVPVTEIKIPSKSRLPANSSPIGHRAGLQITEATESRESDHIAIIHPRSSTVNTYEPAFTDLVPLQQRKLQNPLFVNTGDISLSEYFKNRLLSLKANSPKEFITREEVTIAGLRLFSRLPGHHLTGKKGSDGRLKSISFNTQLLAFSIPVNREL